METQYVTISELRQEETKRDWKALTINGRLIKFLQEPLLDCFSADMNVSNRVTYWRLKFFASTEHEVGLFVSLQNLEEEPSGDSNVLAKAIWQVGSCGDNLDACESEIQRASQWLRGSNALKRENYEDRGNLWMCVDGAGLSVISWANQYHRFERAVLLLALACAYRLRIERLVGELARWRKGVAELSNLAKKATEFNAHCYFRYPVLMERVELPFIWERISSRLHIQDVNQELIEQLAMLHQLIASEERERARAELERARDRESRRWQIASLILALISAVQIIELVPEDVRTTWFNSLLSVFFS